MRTLSLLLVEPAGQTSAREIWVNTGSFGLFRRSNTITASQPQSMFHLESKERFLGFFYLKYLNNQIVEMESFIDLLSQHVSAMTNETWKGLVELQ